MAFELGFGCIFEVGDVSSHNVSVYDEEALLVQHVRKHEDLRGREYTGIGKQVNVRIFVQRLVPIVPTT